jgi:LysR family transcriptional regulator, transcription activator of glutamate synthase operon
VELRQLVYFEAVVRCGGFTPAARDLHVAQPAVSAQVRRLETELGARLLARTSRRVALTEAGEVFLGRVRRVLDELDAARRDVGDLAAVLRGHVTLGATAVLGGIDLPALLAGFAGSHPGVTVSLRTGLVGPLVDGLGPGGIDLVLGPVHDDLPSSVLADPLVGDRIVLITPPGRLPGGDPVALRAVRDEPFVCLPPDGGLHGLLLATAAAAGFEARVRFEATTPQDMRALVAAGLGVALIATSVLDRPGPPVDVRELVDPPPHPPFGILRHAGTPLAPAAGALRDHVVDAHRRRPGSR